MTNFEAYGKNPDTGRQIIKVKHVSTREFEENPNMIWDYDVMMHGTWDANEWNAINNDAVDVIGRYIDSGKGVITGHDTMGYKMGKTYGISRLANKFNLILGFWPGMPNSSGVEIQGNKGWAYGSSKVKIEKKGFLTQFPWKLGPVGTVLDIPYTHGTSNAAKGNVWMEFTEGAYWSDPALMTEAEARQNIPSEANHKYYLTTWNNTAMIQTGHSNGNSTEDERKVLANTLFYLKQLTKKTEILDNSARDITNPNKPGNISTAVNEDNTTNIRFRRPEDNGSTYEYYVKGLDGSREFTSDTKSATITTGVKKYKYQVVEGTADPIEDGWREATTTEDNENLNIGEVNYTGTPKYIHIKTVDGAGNESEVYTQKLEKPNAQEIEITKEVVNGKNEYKVGDRITYKVKFKIKENETNKGKISNVSLVDTYNSSYLKLVNNSIVKQNGIEVNISVIGKIQTNIPTLNYGETKEIQYDMEILDTANRKR